MLASVNFIEYIHEGLTITVLSPRKNTINKQRRKCKYNKDVVTSISTRRK